jgi:hypothetical protein
MGIPEGRSKMGGSHMGRVIFRGPNQKLNWVQINGTMVPIEINILLGQI